MEPNETKETPLAEAYLSVVAQNLSEQSLWDLESTLGEVVASARSAWPAVELDSALFVRYLAERGEADVDPRDALIKLKSDDLYLACACAFARDDGLRAFEETFVKDLERVVPNIDEATPDEVMQIVRTQLFSPESTKIREYSGRGSLRSWLRIVATRVALQLRRKKRPEAPSDDQVFDALPTPEWDPELGMMKRKYRNELKESFAEAFGALDRRERNLLRQHLLDGLSIDALGALYQVHRATAARWVSAAREKVLKEAKKSLRKNLGINDDEFRSIVRLVRSQMDLSLHRLLQDTSDDVD